MAEIPSEIASSAAQVGYKAREVGTGRAANTAAAANSAERQVKAIDASDTTVETDDADVQIFNDAEGAGSQGRAPDAETESDPEVVEDSKGVTEGDDGRLHLDLEA